MTEKKFQFSQTGGIAVGRCWQEMKAGRGHLAFPGGSAAKECTCNAGDLDSIPGLGRSPGAGKGYPLQYSGLENSMDCIVHGVTELDTTEQLSLSFSFRVHSFMPSTICDWLPTLMGLLF